MTVQQLFYERVTPVSQQRHGDWSVDTKERFAFARDVASVPLMTVEMLAAARDYTVVFAGPDGAIMPIVILGVEGQHNLYIKEDNTWDAAYVPAFVRRYPFVFAASEDGKTFTLCIDESWSGCNQEGGGERLFGEDGEKTPYLDGVLGFLKEYQSQFQVTRAFCKKLQELDLIEPMQLKFTLASGKERAVTGFLAVNRDKLKALSPETLSDLARSDALELVYSHLYSLRNFSPVLDRLAKQNAALADKDGSGEKSAAAAEG